MRPPVLGFPSLKIGVRRIEPSGRDTLKGLTDDPMVTAAAEQTKKN